MFIDELKIDVILLIGLKSKMRFLVENNYIFLQLRIRACIVNPTVLAFQSFLLVIPCIYPILDIIKWESLTNLSWCSKTGQLCFPVSKCLLTILGFSCSQSQQIMLCCFLLHRQTLIPYRSSAFCVDPTCLYFGSGGTIFQILL